MSFRLKRKTRVLIRRRALYLLLGFLMVGHFLNDLPEEYFRIEQIVFLVLVSLAFVAGSFTVATNARISRWAWALLIVTVFTRLYAHFVPQMLYQVAANTTSLIFIGFVTMRISGRVFDRSKVTSDKIAGAVTIYLLFGLFFATIFTLTELIAPRSFNFATPPHSFYLMHREMVYFSFITLTTVGFGDVTALTGIARSFSILEACVGVLFPNILIARLVSLEIMQSQRRTMLTREQARKLVGAKKLESP
jgi:hypothetical protein